MLVLWDPISNGQSFQDGGASVIQTGGTNFGAVSVGGYGGGTYTLSNGCSFVPGLTLANMVLFNNLEGPRLSLIPSTWLRMPSIIVQEPLTMASRQVVSIHSVGERSSPAAWPPTTCISRTEGRTS